MANRVIHFELPSDHPEISMEFFGKVFGWTFQQFGNEAYWEITTGDENSPGINGGIMKKRDPRQPLTNTIQVADFEETQAAIEAAGGTIVVPKMPIPGIGWLGYFTDPDGSIHGFMQADPSAKL